MIAVDSSKQNELVANFGPTPQINFTATLDKADDTRIHFILEEAKEPKLGFSKGTVKVL